MKTVIIGKKKYVLPFVDLIPMAEADKADLLASIKAKGILEPVIAWNEKSKGDTVYVIDGANRVLVAEKLELRKVPLRRISALDVEDAKLQCRILNLHRRHLTREERRLFIERMLKEHPDWSNRKIAEATGSSPQTVNRKRPGRGNGKSRANHAASTRPDSNTQTSENDAQGNSQEQKSEERANGARKKSVNPADTALRDDFGNEIPQGCRNAWGDPWIQRSIDFLAEVGETIRLRRLADGMNNRKQHYPFFNAKDFVDGVGMLSHTIDELLYHLKVKSPAGVCPRCKGKGCPSCQMSGLVPRDLYKLLTEAETFQ